MPAPGSVGSRLTTWPLTDPQPSPIHKRSLASASHVGHVLAPVCQRPVTFSFVVLTRAIASPSASATYRFFESLDNAIPVAPQSLGTVVTMLPSKSATTIDDVPLPPAMNTR